MYIIKNIKKDLVNHNSFENIEPIKIENYPWDTTGYKPETFVKLFYTEDNLHIKFTSSEKQVLVDVTEFNGPVFTDSCVEFFFLPDPKNDSRYFNFEINAAGVLLLQLDSDTKIRDCMTYVNPKYFEIKSDVTTTNYRDFDNFKPWTVEYKIPFKFLKDLFVNFEATSGTVIKCNFYKCGNKTLTRHFGAWANIINEKPAFHKPEFFQNIIFE